jgi:hypothetical protein
MPRISSPRWTRSQTRSDSPDWGSLPAGSSQLRGFRGTSPVFQHGVTRRRRLEIFIWVSFRWDGAAPSSLDPRERRRGRRARGAPKGSKLGRSWLGSASHPGERSAGNPSRRTLREEIERIAGTGLRQNSVLAIRTHCISWANHRTCTVATFLHRYWRVSYCSFDLRQLPPKSPTDSGATNPQRRFHRSDPLSR